jgi:disulfide bond formation protein DsbB
VDVTTLSRFFALLALVTGAGAVLVAASAFARRGPLFAVREAMAPIGLPLAWLVALTCTLGSLYFSEVAHFVPCRLCWYQRIAMYPLALILGIATFRRDDAIRRYAIPVAAVGAAVSIYHVQLERFPDQQSFCAVEAPCNLPPVEQFGFVTLAVMALCGFAAIIALLAVARSRPGPHGTTELAPGPADRTAVPGPAGAGSPAPGAAPADTASDRPTGRPFDNPSDKELV